MNSDDPLDEKAQDLADTLWNAGYSDFTVQVTFGSTVATAHSPDRRLVNELSEDIQPDEGDLFNWFASMEDKEAL